MVIPCDNCEMPDYCNEIRRCFRAGIETDTEEGVVTDDNDDLADEVFLKKKKVKTVNKLTEEHRDFLKDVINL